MCENIRTYCLFLHQRALESSLILNVQNPERTRKQWSSIQRGLMFLRGSKFFTWLGLGVHSGPAGSAVGPAALFQDFPRPQNWSGTQGERKSPQRRPQERHGHLRHPRRIRVGGTSSGLLEGGVSGPFHVPSTAAMMTGDSCVKSDWFGVKMWKLTY